MTKIVIIGAGVSGLTTAYLLSKNKSYSISIVARNLPGDIDTMYTSPFAGANWHSFAPNDKSDEQELDKPGYNYFMKLAETDPKSGVWIRENIEYLREEDMNSFELPWFKSFARDFRIIPKSEFPTDDIVFGYSFKTVVISTSIYLNYLLLKCVDNGVTYTRAHLNHIQDANDHHQSNTKPDIIINCSGLLASKLGGVVDTNVFPIRGQTLLVRNNCENLTCVASFPGYPNEMLYMMPRKEGGTIIGGCFLAHNYSDVIDYPMTTRIMERAIKYCPQIINPSYKNNSREIDIVRINVGLRPARVGGPRVEIEGNYIHNYGAAGAGYQSSIGLSEKVVKLTEKLASKSISKL